MDNANHLNKMKTVSTILHTAVLALTIIAAPVLAQTDASSETQKSNAPAQVSKAQEATNSQNEDKTPVRIDATGVHIGGENPMDINVPGAGGGIGPWVGPLIPIISVLAVFGMPVIVVGFFLYFRHRRNKMLHETLRAMVEKGVPIPPELISGGGAAFVNGPTTARGQNDFRNGLILVGLGIGVLMLRGTGGMMFGGFSRLGIIPLFIGIAMIVAWFIGKKLQNNKPPQ